MPHKQVLHDIAAEARFNERDHNINLKRYIRGGHYGGLTYIDMTSPLMTEAVAVVLGDLTRDDVSCL